MNFVVFWFSNHVLPCFTVKLFLTLEKWYIWFISLSSHCYFHPSCFISHLSAFHHSSTLSSSPPSSPFTLCSPPSISSSFFHLFWYVFIWCWFLFPCLTFPYHLLWFLSSAQPPLPPSFFIHLISLFYLLPNICFFAPPHWLFSPPPLLLQSPSLLHPFIPPSLHPPYFSSDELRCSSTHQIACLSSLLSLTLVEMTWHIQSQVITQMCQLSLTHTPTFRTREKHIPGGCTHTHTCTHKQARTPNYRSPNENELCILSCHS